MADPVVIPDVQALPLQSDLVISGVTQYFQYTIQKERYRVEGILQLPIYGAIGTSSVVGRLHSAMERMKIYWIVQSKIGQPILPDPLLFDSNNRFLYGEQGGDSPMILPSQTAYAWRLWGTYHYAIISPQGLTDDFQLPRKPHYPVEENTPWIESELFQQGILDFAGDFQTPILRTNEAGIDDNVAFDDIDVSNTPLQGP